jgi:hypothetical protein
MSDCWNEDQYAPSPAPQTPESSSPDPVTGTADAIEVVTAPIALAEEVFAPETTKLPFGWAVLGACVVAVIWAASIDSKKK